jgi:isoleucyl-tRNA synthetase
MIRYSLNPLPQKLGKRLGANFPKVQKMLREGAETEVTAWARLLLDGQPLRLGLNGQTVEVTPDEVEVRRNASAGYAVAEENGYVAALNTTLTDTLIAEGLAREAVRRIQLMRKDAEYELNDRITVTYKASDKLAKALTANADYVRNETLADSLNAADLPQGDRADTFEFDGESVIFAVKRV